MNYQAWEECRKSLELELNQDEFSTWISPLAYSEEQDEFGMQAVTLLAPNDFIKEHVKQNYDSIIKQYLSRSLDSENLSLNYDLFNSPKPLITKDKSKKIPFLDDKENSLFENFTFETFVEGKSNNIALAAAKQVADSPKGAYNPLFIYGGVGLGKTHLMHAVGNKLKEKDPSKSRLGWGLPVIVEPPELETRVAILLKKAEELNLNMPQDCAFFISERIRSNVRELEGALKRVGANAKFANKEVDLNLIKESLRDLLAIQARQVSIDNIQKTVSDYFNIRLSDLLSSKRNRSLARPRQLSMSLAKELTNHSLPEIGDAFGGRDHTTVLHACKKIGELRQGNTELDEDYKNLVRVLTA
jgi:chromosomal replication initiation ATPase DnaA